jgi:hypothetical protein
MRFEDTLKKEHVSEWIDHYGACAPPPEPVQT